MTVQRAFDSASEAALDPAALVGSAACFYVGSGLPSQAWFDDCAAHEIPLLAIQESDPRRALEGYGAGVDDVAFAHRRLALRTISNLAGIAYAVSDNSRFDPNDGGAKIADYGQAVAVDEPLPFTFYGNRYAVDSALGGALRVAGLHIISAHGGWLPETWDFDALRDLMMQVVNTPTPIPGTDQNVVVVDFFTKAQPPAPVTHPPEESMFVIRNNTNGTLSWCTESGRVAGSRALTADGPPSGTLVVQLDDDEVAPFLAAITPPPPTVGAVTVGKQGPMKFEGTVTPE